MATIEPGTRIGAFEILAPLGAGGQGEVYKARDVRLDRSVAIKILPKHIADDPDRRQRFEREAQTIAKLNHAHICVLHDVGRQDGLDYLVMEYLDGQTLAERLSQGPLPLKQALELAIQIGDALDKAHQQGVVHRDVKPSNIMVTKSGAKLMDFGLAKRREPGSGFAPASEVPTGADITAQGTILGTLQYMAPEQLEGKEADTRSDVWGFGGVLYEMITGKRAFEAKSQVSLMAAILEHEPAPIRTLRPLTPPALEHIVKRCFVKDPERRWQTFRDLVIELQSLGEAEPTATAGPSSLEVATLRRRSRYAWLTAAVLGLAALSLVVFVFFFMSPKSDQLLTRFNVDPPTGTSFFLLTGKVGVISPDGRKLAFIANAQGEERRLWVQPLDSLTAQGLPGTESATSPFWSQDSRHIAFFAQTKLKKIDVTGGPALTITDGFSPLPGTWLSDGTILFTPGLNGPVVRVSAAGGTPSPVTTLDQGSREGMHVLPQMLPDGRHFLYRAPAGPQLLSSENSTPVFIGDLNSKDRKGIGNLPASAIYVSPGYLLFVRDRTLMAQQFDYNRPDLSGEPFRLVEGVTDFSVSNNGVLATHQFAQGPAAPVIQATWFDRQGRQTPLKDLPPADFSNLEFSSDGKRFAISRGSQETLNIWLHDLARGITSRFTFDTAFDTSPRWSPDGTYVSFARNVLTASLSTLFLRKNSSGAGDQELLAKLDGVGRVEDLSPDGHSLLYGLTDFGTRGLDLSILPLEGDKKPRPFLQTDFTEKDGRFSPNEKWVVYASNQSGRFEIYVRSSTPSSSAQWQISKNGGLQPRWRRDGKELFYLSLDGKMMAVPIQEISNAIEWGAAKTLFETKLSPPTAAGAIPRSDYDVTPDAQRFLVLLPISAPNDAVAPAEPIHVILNWPALLKK